MSKISLKKSKIVIDISKKYLYPHTNRRNKYLNICS